MKKITERELAGLLMRAINHSFPHCADNDRRDGTLTFATPATGQLFTITIREKK